MMEDATNICQEADHSFINEIKDANFPKFSEKCDLSSSKSASNELESRHISDVAHFEFVFLEGKFIEISQESVASVNLLGPYRNEKYTKKISSKSRFVKKVEKSAYSLHISVANNDIEEVRNELQINKVSPNTKDHKNRTPLHLAACRGFTEVAKLLLEGGADPNLKDCVGNTPLHLAATASSIDVVTLLLKSGADIFAVDKEKHNPIQLAQTKLRHFQRVQNGQMLSKTKEEVYRVTCMLVAFLEAEKKHRKEVDELSKICSHISLSNTVDEVQDDVKEILGKINMLNL